MMVVYKKSTKENTNIAPIILFFLKSLFEEIELRGGIREVMTFVIKSKDTKYCYDAIRMVEKTFKRKNIDCKMSSYLNHVEDKSHMYVWKLKKIVVTN